MVLCALLTAARHALFVVVRFATVLVVKVCPRFRFRVVSALEHVPPLEAISTHGSFAFPVSHVRDRTITRTPGPLDVPCWVGVLLTTGQASAAVLEACVVS